MEDKCRPFSKSGDEALIDTDDVHLYFTPVRLLHDAVTRSMMNRAVRKLTRADSLP